MKRCRKCGGSRIIYDREIEAGSHGDLKLCSCVDEMCECNGHPPYDIFDTKGNHRWCHCRIPRMNLTNTKKSFKESQIPRKYMWNFIEDFKVDFEDPEVSKKAHKFQSLVNTLKESFETNLKKGYYFWGNTGSGKTLLACIALQELMLRYSKQGRYVDLSRQFFQRLRNSYDIGHDSYGTSGQILDELINVPFLVIDDFGTQRNTEWESEMLYNLIDSRYGEERVTIITSNINIKDYSTGAGNNAAKNPYVPDGIDAAQKGTQPQWKRNQSSASAEPLGQAIAKRRIYSRINEMCNIIHVDLPDYRETLARFY